MTKGSKTLLKIGLVLYLIISVLSILKLFDIKGLEEILKISNISIPMTTIILLAYAWDKGDDTVCKIGILCLVVSIVVGLLRSFGVIDTIYGEKMIDKIAASVRDVASGGLSLCAMLALLNLIPISDDRSSILKVVAVLAYVVYIFLNVSGNFVNLLDSKLLLNVQSLCSYVSNFAEYSFIVVYLLNKKVDPVKEIKQENPVLQQQIVIEQPTQPVTEPVIENPMFTTPPYNPQVVQQPVPQVMPQQVIQQPVIQQPVTVPETEPVTQPAPTGPMIPQIVMPTTPPVQ